MQRRPCVHYVCLQVCCWPAHRWVGGTQHHLDSRPEEALDTTLAQATAPTHFSSAQLHHAPSSASGIPAALARDDTSGWG